MEDIRVLAFFYIEQAGLMAFVGMSLLGVHVNWKQVVLMGVSQGLMIYLARSILYGVFGMPFGFHTLVTFLTSVILLYFVVKRDFGVCLAATALAFIVMLLSESMMLPIFHIISPFISLQSLITNTWLHIVSSYIGSWLLWAVALYMIIFKKPLINIETRKQKV